MLLLRILLWAYHRCKDALPVLFSLILAFCLFTFAAFVINALTLSSQYGCDVRGWSVLCPSRRVDWVPHCARSPRSDHKWTGTVEIWQLFAEHIWLLFCSSVMSVNGFLSSTTSRLGDRQVSGRCQPFYQWLLEEYFSCPLQIPSTQVSLPLFCSLHNYNLSIIFSYELIRGITNLRFYHVYLCITDILAVCGAVRQWKYNHHSWDHNSLRHS